MLMKNIEFQLPHLKLAGFTNGLVGKPPLLALHGWLDNAGSFELMMPYWNDHHVVAIDLPGHGLSPKRSIDAHYHFVDWAYDVFELIEHLHWSSVSIVGHSMGGMIGTMVASALPEQINRLILIDSLGFITTAPENARDQLREALFSRRKISTKSKGYFSTHQQAVAARVLAGGVTEAEALVLAKRGLQTNGEGFSWRSDGRLRTASALRLSIDQALSFIQKIECPVLMVAGRQGANMVKQNQSLYQPHFADIRCLEMDGGHHCHMTYPKTAARLVSDFLALG
jgi:pimeloyl-ACP methyl ester carboxylesterase